MLSDTQRLRDFAARLLGANASTSAPNSTGLSDGKTALIRTSNGPSADGPGRSVPAQHRLYRQRHHQGEEQIDSGAEVYLIPTDVARQALETCRAEWLANPATITNKPDDDLEVIYFDRAAAGRADSFESKNDYATKWAQYKLSNSRLVGAARLPHRLRSGLDDLADAGRAGRAAAPAGHDVVAVEFE